MSDDEIKVAIVGLSNAIVSTVCSAAQTITSEGSKYCRILVDLDFEYLFMDVAYDQWIRENLMCRRAVFLNVVSTLRVLLDDNIIVDKYSKRHSFAKKVGILFYFLSSQGGYRETANTFGLSLSWTCDIIVTL